MTAGKEPGFQSSFASFLLGICVVISRRGPSAFTFAKSVTALSILYSFSPLPARTKFFVNPCFILHGVAVICNLWWCSERLASPATCLRAPPQMPAGFLAGLGPCIVSHRQSVPGVSPLCVSPIRIGAGSMPWLEANMV